MTKFKGVIVDPLSTPIKSQILIIGLSNESVLRELEGEFSTDDNGKYDFDLDDGLYEVYIKQFATFEPVGQLNVNEDLKSPISILEAIRKSAQKPITPIDPKNWNGWKAELEVTRELGKTDFRGGESTTNLATARDETKTIKHNDKYIAETNEVASSGLALAQQSTTAFYRTDEYNYSSVDTLVERNKDSGFFSVSLGSDVFFNRGIINNRLNVDAHSYNDLLEIRSDGKINRNTELNLNNSNLVNTTFMSDSTVSQNNNLTLNDYYIKTEQTIFDNDISYSIKLGDIPIENVGIQLTNRDLTLKAEKQRFQMYTGDNGTVFVSDADYIDFGDTFKIDNKEKRVKIKGYLDVENPDDFKGDKGDTIFEVYQYSASNNPFNWHDTLKEGDNWRRVNKSVNGYVDPSTWSIPYKITGADGQKGDTYFFIYEFAPKETGPWHLAPIAVGDNFRRERISDNGKLSPWSKPVRVTGIKGEDGIIVTFQYQYSIDGVKNWHSNFASGDHYRRERITKWPSDQEFPVTDGSQPLFASPWSAAEKITPVKGEDYFDGISGNNGLSTATITIYQRADKQPAPPSNPVKFNVKNKTIVGGSLGDWKLTMPSGTTNLYGGVALLVTNATEDVINPNEWSIGLIGSKGADGAKGEQGNKGDKGDKGKDGLNGLTMIREAMYKVSDTPLTGKDLPNKIKYNIEDNSYTGNLNGWSATIPNAPGKIWISSFAVLAKADVNIVSVPDNRWSFPVKIAENGTDGYNLISKILYRTSNVDLTEKDKPTKVKYNLESETFSGNMLGWSDTLSNNPGKVWMITFGILVKGTVKEFDIPDYKWSIPSKLANNGVDGQKGNQGDKGSKGDKGDKGNTGDKGSKGDKGDKGSKGKDGIDGYGVIRGILYKVSNTQLKKENVPKNITYDVDKNIYTGDLNGWTKSIPNSPGKVWIVEYTMLAKATTKIIKIPNDRWDEPAKLADNGEKGLDGYSLLRGTLYRASKEVLTKDSLPSKVKYDTDTDTFSGNLNNWSEIIPDSPGNVWVANFGTLAKADAKVVLIPDDRWTLPAKLANNGKDGSKGNTGNAGKDGKDGKNGIDGYTILNGTLYKASTTPLSNKDVPLNVIYNIENNSFTGDLKGWTANIPNKPGLVWVTNYAVLSKAKAKTVSIPNTRWSDPSKLSENGKDGQKGKDGNTGKDGAKGKDGYSVIKGTLYRVYSGNLERKDLPKNVTYNIKTQTYTGQLYNAWTKNLPNAPGKVWATEYIVLASSDDETVQIPDSRWTDPAKLAVNGDKGNKGDKGDKGSKGDKGNSGDKGDKGLNGYSIVRGVLYRVSDKPLKNTDLPTDVKYNTDENTYSGTLNNWTPLIPDKPGKIWIIDFAVAAKAETKIVRIPNTRWSAPAKLAENGVDGKDGKSGNDGYSIVRGTLYIPVSWTVTRKNLPKNITYNIKTNTYTGDFRGRWVQNLPNNPGNVWVTKFVMLVRGNPETVQIPNDRWTDPARLAVNGKDGKSGYSVINRILYKASSKPLTANDRPTKVIYNTATDIFTGNLKGWTKDIPNTPGNIWITNFAMLVRGNLNLISIPDARWSIPAKLAENGKKGDNGASGSGFYAKVANGGKWPGDDKARRDFAITVGRNPQENDHFTYKEKESGKDINSTTKRWDGKKWVAPQAIFNGDILIDGTVTGDKIVSNSIEARMIKGDQAFFNKVGVQVIYNLGGNESNYKMKLDLKNGGFHIR